MASSGGYGQGSFSSLANEIERAAVSFGALVASAGAFGQAVNSFRLLEREIVKTGAVANSTTEEMKTMEKAVRSFATASTTAAVEAAQAMYDFASAGFTAKESMNALVGTLLLSQATLTPAAAAADVLASNIRAFGLEADQAYRVANVFTAAIVESQADMQKLSFAFRQVGPVAKVANLSIEETTTLLSQLFNVGLRGEQAGTALRNIIVRLAQPVGASDKVLRQLGITTTDLTGRMRPLTEILKELRAKNLSEGDLANIFGVEALAGGIALIEGSGRAYENLKSKIEGTNSAYVIAQKQLNTLDGSIQLLLNNLNELAIKFGQTLAPYIRDLADSLVDLIQSFESMDAATQGWYLKLAAATAATLTLVGGLNLLMALTRPFIAVFTGFAAVVGKLAGVVALAHPGIGLLTKAIGIIAGGALLGTAAGKIHNFANTIEASFTPDKLEPLVKFGDQLERELNRVNRLFTGNEGSIDRQRVLIQTENNAKEAMKGAEQQVKERTEAVQRLEGDLKKYQEAQDQFNNLTSENFRRSDKARMGNVAEQIKRGLAGADQFVEAIAQSIENSFAGGKSAAATFRNAMAKGTAGREAIEDLTRAIGSGEVDASGLEAVEIVQNYLAQNKTKADEKLAQLRTSLSQATKQRDNVQTVLETIPKERLKSAELFVDNFTKTGEGLNNPVIQQFKEAIGATLRADTELRQGMINALATSNDPNIQQRLIDAVVGNLKNSRTIDDRIIAALSSPAERTIAVLDESRDTLETKMRQARLKVLAITGDIAKSHGEIYTLTTREIIANARKSRDEFAAEIRKSLTASLPPTEKISNNRELMDLISGQKFITDFQTDIGTQKATFDPATSEQAQRIRLEKLEEYFNMLISQGINPDIIKALRRDADRVTEMLRINIEQVAGERMEFGDLQKRQIEELRRKTRQITDIAEDAYAEALRTFAQNGTPGAKRSAAIADVNRSREKRDEEINNLLTDYVAGKQAQGITLDETALAKERQRIADALNRRDQATIRNINIEHDDAMRAFDRQMKDIQNTASRESMEAVKAMYMIGPIDFDMVEALGLDQIDLEYETAIQTINRQREDLLKAMGGMPLDQATEDGFQTMRKAAETRKETAIAQNKIDMEDLKTEHVRAIQDYFSGVQTAYNLAQAELNDVLASQNFDSAISAENMLNVELDDIREKYTDLKRAAEDRLVAIQRLKGEHSDEARAAQLSYISQLELLDQLRIAEEQRANSAEGHARRRRVAAEQTIEAMIRDHEQTGTMMDGFRTALMQSQLEIQTNFQLGMDLTQQALTGTIDLMEAGFTRGKEGFAEMLADMAKQLIKAQAYQLLLKLVGMGMGYMGWGAAPASAAPTQGPAFGSFGARSEKGNVFEYGNLRRFANGGVVERYTEFPTRDGRRNSMAENGPEAIMPLQRTPDGRLGVAGMGGGGITNHWTIQATVNANGGTPEQNDDLAGKIGKQLYDQVRGIVGQELRIQSRPGGTMNRR